MKDVSLPKAEIGRGAKKPLPEQIGRVFLVPLAGIYKLSPETVFFLVSQIYRVLTLSPTHTCTRGFYVSSMPVVVG